MAAWNVQQHVQRKHAVHNSSVQCGAAACTVVCSRNSLFLMVEKEKTRREGGRNGERERQRYRERESAVQGYGPK